MSEKKNAGAPKLFIGPWVGEFGIEILHWQGLARTIAGDRAWSEVVVGCRRDRAFLYEDFADSIVVVEPPGGDTAGPRCDGYDGSLPPWGCRYQPDRGDVWLTPHVSRDHFRTIVMLAARRSTFRNFSSGVEQPSCAFDVLIHARATSKSGQRFKNWSVANWEALIDALPADIRVASVGSRSGAHKIRGTEDLRNASLAELAAHCDAAKLLIGPSSGAVHFALHCGLPVLTWMGNHRHHYHRPWNPERVPLVCLPTWQPHPDAVLRRFRDLWLIEETKRNPLGFLVIGTKRSGHHAVIEWLTRIHPDRCFTHWNDCVSATLRTPPEIPSNIPSDGLLPKQLNQLKPRDLIVRYNAHERRRERILSLEGPALHELHELPEAHEAKRIVFVLRDGMNLAASLQKAFHRQYGAAGYLHPALREMMEDYRQYLWEATGRGDRLGPLKEKTVFLSYDRWHVSKEYRRSMAQILGGSRIDVPRESVAGYGPRSGFQAPDTPADELATLERWTHGLRRHDFATVACPAELFEAEREFHGDCLPAADLDLAWRDPPV